MRILPIDKLEPGMTMGERIELSGQVMLNTGAKLTAEYIDRLRQMGLNSVLIDDEQSRDIRVETTLSPDTHRRGVSVVGKLFDEAQSELEKIQAEVTESVEKAVEDSRFVDFISKSPSFASVMEYCQNLLEEICNSPAGIALNSLKNHDAHMFQHSVDVAVMAVSIGRAQRLPDKQLEDLAYGCLLHDLGKIILPRDLLSLTPGQMNAEQRKLVRTHPLVSRRILLSNSKIAQRTRAVIIATQHHENHDGSGFPYSLKGDDRPWTPELESRGASTGGIYHLAAIANIANVFDNLTSPRPGAQEPLSYIDAAFVMVNRLYARFHPAYLDSFLKILNVFPEGSNIQLHEGPYKGYVGTVVKSTRDNRFAPLVRLFFDDRRQKLDDPIEVDLQSDTESRATRRSLQELEDIPIDIL